MVPAFGGLTTEEAARRLAEVGANEIQREPQTPAWRLLARQFSEPGHLAARSAPAVVSGALGEVADAVAIGAHRRAERAGRLLPGAPRRARRAGAAIDDGAARARACATATASSWSPRRRRPGRLCSCSRRATSSPRTRACIEAHALSTNEAALTGESAPVEKTADADAPGRAARRAS